MVIIVKKEKSSDKNQQNILTMFADNFIKKKLKTDSNSNLI